MCVRMCKYTHIKYHRTCTITPMSRKMPLSDIGRFRQDSTPPGAKLRHPTTCHGPPPGDHRFFS